jgi:hypothetical protein
MERRSSEKYLEATNKVQVKFFFEILLMYRSGRWVFLSTQQFIDSKVVPVL